MSNCSCNQQQNSGNSESVPPPSQSQDESHKISLVQMEDCMTQLEQDTTQMLGLPVLVKACKPPSPDEIAL
jgi:hypothetical protein